MNHLAHLLLAEGRPGWTVGAILADFVKGPVPDDIPADLQFGIRLHRRIDAASDLHPIFLKDREHFSKPVRRYAGIYLDLAHDHFLLKHWARFSDEHPEAFMEEQYEILRNRDGTFDLPDRMRLIVKRILTPDHMGSYREWGQILRVAETIGIHRLRKPNKLADGLPELTQHRAAFEKSFLKAFPDIVREVAEMKGNEIKRGTGT